MHWSWWTFLFQIVNFLVVVYVLNRVLYRPLRDAVDRRREADARARAEVDEARQAAETLQTQARERLAEIDQHREQSLRQVRDQAEAERRRMLDEGATMAARRREELDQHLQRERDEALRSLRRELADSAVRFAERLLRGVADPQLHQQLLGRLTDTLAAIPEPNRQRLRAGWAGEDGAVLEAAEPCAAEALDRLRAALARLAGRTVSIEVQEQPVLICGVRLRMGDQVWDANLADRLDEARKVASETDTTGSSP